MWIEKEDLSPQAEKGIPGSRIHTCKGPEARRPAGGAAGAALAWLEREAPGGCRRWVGLVTRWGALNAKTSSGDLAREHPGICGGPASVCGRV